MVGASVALALAIGYWAYFVTALAVLEILGAGQPQPTVLAALGLFGGVMLHPASSALRAVMDQLLFGERPDPLDAAARVVGRIGEDPEEALRSLREDLAVPYVALWRGTRLVAQSGEPVHHVRRIVTHSGEAEEATLVVGMRAGDLRLSSGDAHVLKLVTPLLVQLVRTTELSAAVQDSRARRAEARSHTDRHRVHHRRRPQPPARRSPGRGPAQRRAQRHRRRHRPDQADRLRHAATGTRRTRAGDCASSAVTRPGKARWASSVGGLRRRRRTAAASGRGRGRRVPHRDGGVDQCRQALRLEHTPP